MQAWILLFLPLVSAIIIHFLLRQKLATIAAVLGTVATGIGLALSFLLLGSTDTPAPIHWISVGDFHIDIGLKLDQLSTGMMIVVTGIGFLVHLFSLGYMKDDDAKARYFGNLSLFMFSMTGIVLANNFIMMFIFWELVGLSSYLLIGHWYKKDTAADAAKKAFLSNRVGDFGFIIGILMLWGLTATFTFAEMGEAGLTQATPFFGAAVLLIFCGAIGKSAQLPLHVWLPDAMEGPTPVSALIHAATMVAAGVYMMARLFLSVGVDVVPLCSASTIAWIGGLTSLFAALMATQQDDIKKILAYSTLSQLGYMVMAVGLIAPEASMFHLYTHAWFKALLFLGSGAVIYACHHEQDIWKMGGLFKKMPITAITFLIGTAALTAVPFTSGFYSKEGILHAAHHQPLFWVAAFVAMLTTFYMFRLFFVAFLGKARGHGAEEAKEVSPLMSLPLLVLAVMALASPFLSQFFPWDETASGKPIPFHAKPAMNDILWTSIGAFTIGLVLAFIFYFGKDRDPLKGNAIMKVFRNKFYVDEFYGGLVKYVQDIGAAIVDFFDQFVINGLIVGGLTRTAQGLGGIFRRTMQSGNLQNYAYLLGGGIILVIYLTVFI
ncbi:NADH dehydrogenase subunit L [Rubritalea squalenifaciens DSM 18772]|uniref:NADH dehydrogenase subunit L n=1 Tax=Rubritalea squalenifaciens DSM 18772 TaxID=1123071 RepID=A0A1M6J4V2_9BACT|nr:NADH-quinone oxidoreductase subunit L [Rubritalea squalenifaciens]SHJ41730.1 NADH dehydrogenase subunit L [Rubritalea squalenifaciens DSM 18772]